MTQHGITIGRYTWTPRRTRETTWQMTITKLILCPIAAAGVAVALIGWGQPDMLHPLNDQGIPVVTVQTNR